MDRSTKISILANMSDEALTRALEVNGIPDDENYLDHLGPELAGGLESWSERDVSIPRSERPQLANTDFLFRSPVGIDELEAASVDAYGMPVEDTPGPVPGLEMF